MKPKKAIKPVKAWAVVYGNKLCLDVLRNYKISHRKIVAKSQIPLGIESHFQIIQVLITPLK